MSKSSILPAKFRAVLLSVLFLGAFFLICCCRQLGATDISGTVTITQAGDLSGNANFANNSILNVQTNGITVSNNFNFASSGFTAASIQVGANTVFTANSALNFQQANASSANNINILNKTGAGTLILGGSEAANTNSYTFKVTEGTLQLGTGTGSNWTSGKWVSLRFDGAATKKLVVNQSGDTNITRMVLTGGTVNNVELSNIGTGKLSLDFNHGSTTDYGYVLTNLSFSGSGDIALKTYPVGNLDRIINGLSSSGTGAYSLTISNTFRVNREILKGNISGFTGTLKTTSSAGLQLQNELAIGGGKNIDLVLDASDKLDTGVTVTTNSIANSTIQFGSITGNGLFQSTSGNAFTLQVGNTIAVGETAVFDGIITASTPANLSVEKVGKGTWVWTNNPGWTTNESGVATDKHTYTGSTTITEGTLQIGNYNAESGSGGTTGALPTNSKIIVSADSVAGSQGTLAFALASDLSVANSLEFNGGGIANANPNSTVTISSVTGTALVKSGEGAVKLATANFSGSIQIDEGTLILNASRGIANPMGNITVGENGVLSLQENNNTLGVCFGGASTFPGLITIEGALTSSSTLRTNLGNVKLIDGTIAVSGAANGPGDIFGNYHLGGTITAEGASSITANALTLRSADNELAAGASGTFIVNGQDSVLTVSSIFGLFNSSNSIKKQGEGTLVLTGGVNNPIAISVEEGTLNLATTAGVSKVSNLTVGTADPNTLSKLLVDTTGQSISGALTLNANGSIWVDAAVFDSKTYNGESLLSVGSITGVDASDLYFFYDESQAGKDTVLTMRLDKIIDDLSVSNELIAKAVEFAQSMDSWASYDIAGSVLTLRADSAKVPEPSSFLLVLFGLTGVLLCRHRFCQRKVAGAFAKNS